MKNIEILTDRHPRMDAKDFTIKISLLDEKPEYIHDLTFRELLNLRDKINLLEMEIQ